MKASRLVVQKYDYSCGVACLAMWLGKTHKKVKDKYFPCYDLDRAGIIEIALLGVLTENGIKAVQYPNLIHRVPGILSVPSLNLKGGQHYIYYVNPRLLYDPNKGRPGKKFYTAKDLENTRVSGHIVDSDNGIVQARMKRFISDWTPFVQSPTSISYES